MFQRYCNLASVWEKISYVVLYFSTSWNYMYMIVLLLNYVDEQCMITPNFLSGFQ